MTTYTKSISEPWFSLIKSGEKNVEGRLDRHVYARLEINDIIIWNNNEEYVTTKVVNITKYKTFYDYLENQGLEKTVPFVKTIDDGVKIYYTFYTKKEEDEFGVLAFQLEVI